MNHSVAGLNEHKHWRENNCFTVSCPICQSDAGDQAQPVANIRRKLKSSSDEAYDSLTPLNMRLQRWAASERWRRPLVSSGSAALDEARVEADVSDVVSVEQPGEEALQAQAVAAVGARAVLPLETHAAAQFHFQDVNIEVD